MSIRFNTAGSHLRNRNAINSKIEIELNKSMGYTSGFRRKEPLLFLFINMIFLEIKKLKYRHLFMIHGIFSINKVSMFSLFTF